MNAPFRFSPVRSGPSSAKNQALAEWRRVDVVPLDKARALSAKTMSAVVPGVLKSLKLDKKQSETEILKVWEHVLNPNITAHARPVGLRNGTLFVSVDSSVWLDEIVRYHRREILQRLQHSFGKEMIKKISFRAG